jgi:ATP-dependent RNA helicase DOB1
MTLMLHLRLRCPGAYVNLLQDDWGWGVVVSVLKKPPKTNAAVNGGAAIAAAAAAAGDGDDAAAAVDVKAIAANAASCYIVDTLLPCKAGSVAAGAARPDPIGTGQGSSPPATDDKAAAGAAAGGGAGGAAAVGSSSAELTVVPVLLPLVTSFSSLRVTLPDDIRPAEVRQSLLCVLQVGGGLGACTLSLAHLASSAGVHHKGL